ncbi:MAG: 2-amino-4-hydroxy-6-hydroxymethyldihydropteridine diphosphokinase [Firmicutes bacterium]|nr:2-amino-4-hydroxy-6-hydroxymethyldihydropteridine diphosphokinase [Bacillota bacterium]
MNKVYLGLGSNIGDTKENINKAIELLKENLNISITNKSSFYETEPVGYTKQDWFLNIVIEIETTLKPYKLLEYCQYIESELKRKRIIRWGPRSIDVDILLYEGFKSNDKDLIVPHPRMCERAFVMVPLYEINKTIEINGKNIKEIIDNLDGEEIRVKKDG